MNEIEELEFDRRMLNAAMNNTYLILTGKATYDALLEKESMQRGSIDQHVETALLFNPMAESYNDRVLYAWLPGNQLQNVGFGGEKW